MDFSNDALVRNAPNTDFKRAKPKRKRNLKQPSEHLPLHQKNCKARGGVLHFYAAFTIIYRMQKKCAVVALIGRPSSGKSTFVNTVCKNCVSITSPFPQTTRNAIRAIFTDERGQLVFIDTPGYHISEKKLNLRLQTLTREQLSDADLILYLIDSTRDIGEEEKNITALLKPLSEKLVVGINKIDSAESKPLPAIRFLQSEFPSLEKEALILFSAKNDVAPLVDAVFARARAGNALYPSDVYTDQDVSFRIAEIIRGEAIRRLTEEMPHCLYVDIADLEKKGENKLWVRAFLCVERESQKRIAIGKNASMIKAIRLASLEKLKKIFDRETDLDLQVRVNRNWRQNGAALQKLIR